MKVAISPYGKGSSAGLVWDGKTLSPWGKGSSAGWELDGLNFFPWGKGSSAGFQFAEEVPIPVLAVAAGLLRVNSES